MRYFALPILYLFFTVELLSQIPQQPEDICPALIGEQIPNENVFSENNESVSLYSLLAAKPTVLIFYRGGWCPYCSKQLAGIAAIEKEILSLGYQIVAISPDDYQNIAGTVDEANLTYRLYSDPQGNLIRKTGLAFETNTKTKLYIKTKNKGEVSEVLPVPTVMVVSKSGEIMFEYINPNYKVRLEPTVLMAVLKSMPPIE